MALNRARAKPPRKRQVPRIAVFTRRGRGRGRARRCILGKQDDVSRGRVDPVERETRENLAALGRRRRRAAYFGTHLVIWYDIWFEVSAVATAAAVCLSRAAFVGCVTSKVSFIELGPSSLAGILLYKVQSSSRALRSSRVAG